MAELRKTPLNDVHRESGARMVPFGGWDMPVEYSGLIAEHTAVRTAAGLFDVSHMGQFEVEGEGALAFLQRVTSNNVAKLVDGQAQYSSLPMPSGCPVDDIIVYRRSERRYLIVVNASNVEKDWSWLLAQHPSACGLHDLSDRFALLALQGPRAAAILQTLTAIDLGAIGFYRFAEGVVDRHEAIVARTGYTGEDGFEVFVAPSDAPALWRRILEAGKPHGILPAGLGARDTLRLEARMMLYGNDMDETTTLVEAGLGWIVSADDAKGDWNGRAVLAAQKAHGAPRKLVGFELRDRGIPRHGHPVLLDGAPVGAVTSGTFAPFLQKSIGLAYLPSERATAGTALEIDIRGRRVAAEVVPTPFYKRPRP
jgi:aminomethyltransferase